MLEKTGQPLIVVENLHFKWGKHVIYDGIDLEVRRGEVTAIMGPSGTGKTTLLKLIGGELKPDRGTIWYDGKDINHLDRTELFRLRSRIGMLFQSGALFSDMDVYENIAFPLRAHTRLNAALEAELVALKLASVNMSGTEDRFPSELSGGMKRRVALARAVALDPELVMYDEPFAGQDPVVMGVLARLIRTLREALGLTSIIVSHDVDETLSIADYVYVIDQGKIQGEGNSSELRQHASRFVQNFISGQASLDTDMLLHANPDSETEINARGNKK